MVRWVQFTTPRCIYAIRAARSAWLAWDEPAIAAHRQAVDDRATAEFMQRFYVALLHDHLTAPEALRKTQNDMALDPSWRSPRYWAGFVLEGDLQ